MTLARRLDTSGLHDHFAVEVHDIDLRTVTGAHLYPQIRAAFEEHSLLLFRNQDLDENAHRRLAELFGPIEDLRGAARGQPAVRAMVSNAVTDGALVADDELRLLDLQANFLWHTDSTFLATPSLTNILIGQVIPSSGGATEFVSTRAGWQRMSAGLKRRAQDKIVVHRFSQSRKLIDERLARQAAYTRFPDARWRTTWRNPVNACEALYIATHACGIDGMSEAAGMALINELIDAVTPPEAIFSHRWRPGDVLIWDERATLHRGTPWPFDEVRTLASFVSSARASDGIDSVRP